MSFTIQRVPQGLADLISSFGGQTPRELAEEVHGSLELIQAYGLSQRTNLAAAAAGVPASLTTPQASFVLSLTRWTVLFAAHAGIQNVTAATTELGFGIALSRGSSFAQGFDLLETRDFVPVVGSNLFLPWVAPYPLLCPPGSQIGVLLYSTLGAAAQSVTINAEWGTLG